MNSYEFVAHHYDALTGNVDYDSIYGFYKSVFKKLNHTPRILLDLACGTGTLTFMFEQDGAEVIGTDISYDMLSEAMDKKVVNDSKALFLNQSAADLDLYGTVDTVVCNLDAVNHFTPDELPRIFERVSLFTEPGGVFIFDVNSEYKFKTHLSDGCYFYDTSDVFCAWTSQFDGVSADIHLDIFEKFDEDTYRRREENITEYMYTREHLTSLLEKSAFDIIGVTADFSLEEPQEKSERIHFIARKRDE